MANYEDVLNRKVMKFGTGGAHITMPKAYVGQWTDIGVRKVGSKPLKSTQKIMPVKEVIENLRKENISKRKIANELSKKYRNLKPRKTLILGQLTVK